MDHFIVVKSLVEISQSGDGPRAGMTRCLAAAVLLCELGCEPSNKGENPRDLFIRTCADTYDSIAKRLDK